jgi:hypothetical protein
MIALRRKASDGTLGNAANSRIGLLWICGPACTNSPRRSHETSDSVADGADSDSISLSSPVLLKTAQPLPFRSTGVQQAFPFLVKPHPVRSREIRLPVIVGLKRSFAFPTHRAALAFHS